MFSPDLSRTLASLGLGLALLTGCAALPPAQVAPSEPVEITTYPTLEQWLGLYRDVEDMTSEEVVDRLGTINKPEGTGQLFYYGLLNQNLQTYGAWTQARDAFQALEEDGELAEENRLLAGMLRQYNQNRINFYLRQQNLVEEQQQLLAQLQESEEEKLQLKQKIEALTEVETVISTRREE